jgi:WD40 repeat protein
VGERPRLTEKDSFLAIAWRTEGWWVAERDRVALVDPSTGSLVREFLIDPSDRFGFTEDGTRVVTGKSDSVRAYSLKTGKLEATLKTGASGVQDLKISRDGRFGLVAAEYHAYFFDLQANVVLRKAKAKIYYSGAVAPDGSRFATPLEVHERPNPAFDIIQVMDGKPGSRAVKFGVGVAEPAWLPDGRILCIERKLSRLAIFDSVTGERQLIIEGALEFPRHLVASPSGRHATCWSNDDLALLDLEQGKVRWLKKQPKSQLEVAFSPDGRQLVLGASTPYVLAV